MLLAAVLLAGCNSSEKRISNVIPEMHQTESENRTAVPDVQKSEPQVVLADSADYEIQKEDRSLQNKNGDMLVEHTYDRVVLLGNAPAYESINAYILEDCEGFFSANASYMNEFDLEELFNVGYGGFLCTAGASVVNNQNGIFSIRIVLDWYMGGVHNGDYYGLTYNLYTGEPVKLEDLSDLPAEEFEQLLKDIAVHWLYDTYGEGLFYPPEEVLEEYRLEDLLFYVENGEIILTFPTYTFTAGAAGASIIPTGIMV